MGFALQRKSDKYLICKRKKLKTNKSSIQFGCYYFFLRIAINLIWHLNLKNIERINPLHPLWSCFAIFLFQPHLLFKNNSTTFYFTVKKVAPPSWIIFIVRLGSRRDSTAISTVKTIGNKKKLPDGIGAVTFSLPLRTRIRWQCFIFIFLVSMIVFHLLVMARVFLFFFVIKTNKEIVWGEVEEKDITQGKRQLRNDP